MYKTFITAALFGALTSGRPQLTRRDILTPLPENASDIEKKYQPLVDFDMDGCWNTAAVDPDGNTNPGKGGTGTPEGDCRDPHQLENSNVYSRARCNNNICGVMYEYYFEKDQPLPGHLSSGHVHEWENVVVFAEGDRIIHIAVSSHGKYGGGDFIMDGTRPYVVYHKEGGSTHSFRAANQADIDGPENFSGEFYTSPLVGWDGWPAGTREAVEKAWPSGITPKILDAHFTEQLQWAAGDNVPGFDPTVDG